MEQCLQNVVDQHCAEAEHLVMDGASTDETPEIVAKWAEKHPHIRLISEKDKGQSDAMNKGIDLAKGKIISFLNVDDYYEPKVLNRVLEIFTDLPEPSFVCGNLNIWNADGSLKHFNKPDRISLVELASNCFEWPYNPSAYFYHKSLHEKTGPYNVDNHYCMDYEFLVEAARHIQLTHVDELWGNFVIVPGSKTENSFRTDINIALNNAEVIRQKVLLGFSQNEKEQLNTILHQFSPLPVPIESTTLTLIQKLTSGFRQIFNWK